MTKSFFTHWVTRLRHHRLLRYFWIFAAIYSLLFFIPLSIAVLRFNKGQEMVVVAIIAFFIGRGIMVGLIHLVYREKRPYQKFKFIPIYFSELFSQKTREPYSFPSGHVTALASMAFVWYFYYPYPAVGWAALLITALTGLGRIILGYHYWYDVAVGLLIGALSAYITYIFIIPRLFTL